MNTHIPRRTAPWRVAAVAAVVALAAAACGGGDTDDSSPAASSETDDTSTGDGAGAEPADEGTEASDSGGDPADSADNEAPGDEPADETPVEEPGDEPSEEDAPAEEPMVLTASWRGVTADEITIGVSMLDFALLKEMSLVQAGWGDQQAVFQAFVDDLNAKGGINGRKLRAIYDFYSPISGDDATRSCTVLTQDHEVFAVLLGFVGPLAGTADPCIVGTNDTTLVGGEQTPDELAQAKKPWFNTEPTTDSHTETLLDLLVATGRADGARVYVVSHFTARGDEPIVLDALAARGIEVLGNAVLDANDGDTAAQDSLMQVISERISAEGATAVMVNGNPAATIRGLGQSGLIGDVDNPVAVWSNNGAGLNNLGATFDHELARGVITSDGPTETEIWNDPLMQDCIAVARQAVPEADLRPPLELTLEDENWFNPVRRYCSHISLFAQIAEVAGADLTPETFEQAALTLTDFALPGVPSNSLSATKLGARDLFRLSEFDPDVGNGQTVPLTDLLDVYP